MRRVVFSVVLLALASVHVPGLEIRSLDAEGEGCMPCALQRPQVLIPIIGSQPLGSNEGATASEPAPTPPPAEGDPYADTRPGGMISQAVGQRAGQLREEGYSVQVAYFSSMQAFLAWAEALALEMAIYPCKCPYTHVEFYGHGATDSSNTPTGNPEHAFDGPPLPELWIRLGNALRNIMTTGVGRRGHIVFGWCWSGVKDPPRNRYPGGLVSGASGHPVCGTPGEIEFPFVPPPDQVPLGHPFSQPRPQGPIGGPGGWHEFPPTVPDPQNPEATVPNDGKTPPSTLQPGSLGGGGRRKLPSMPGDTPLPPLTPLTHPDGTPWTDGSGQPLHGPLGPNGTPVEDPYPGRAGDPLGVPIDPATGEPDGHHPDHSDPQGGRPFGWDHGHPADGPLPSPDNEPYEP